MFCFPHPTEEWTGLFKEKTQFLMNTLYNIESFLQIEIYSKYPIFNFPPKYYLIYK